MSVTKNNLLVRQVRRQIAEGIEKKESLPNPGARFHKLGTIFSRYVEDLHSTSVPSVINPSKNYFRDYYYNFRTTGLIRSGVIPPDEAPIWYSVYKTFPPKYEPTFSRPPLDIKIKEIYYPEDKLRA